MIKIDTSSVNNMFSAFFDSHCVNHCSLIAKSRPKSTSLFESLKLFADAILWSTTTNSRKVYGISKAIFLMVCYKLHCLSPSYILQISKIAGNCNTK